MLRRKPKDLALPMRTHLSAPSRLPLNRSNQGVKHRVPHLAAVRPENERVNVLLSVVLADVDMRATDAGLEVAPEVFHPVHMNVRTAGQMIAANILFRIVVHEFVFPIIVQLHAVAGRTSNNPASPHGRRNRHRPPYLALGQKLAERLS